MVQVVSMLAVVKVFQVPIPTANKRFRHEGRLGSG